MLLKLHLENYRCFNFHTIDFKDLSIVVGKNNAGKSTIIEALRLISIVSNRILNFKDPPYWLDLPRIYKGVSPSLSGLEFSTKNIFHKYQEGPAKIIATFNNNSRIELYVGETSKNVEVFAIFFDNIGNVKKTKGDLNAFGIPQINILPQISALAKEETILTYERVKSNVSTQLSSIHFRNQLRYFPEDFPKFKELAEKTWNGLGIESLDAYNNNTIREMNLSLIVRDNDFAAEIGWMGHGLQMWLQTIWFLSRSSNDSTIILDEPDVYMHADLQRKLIRFLRKRYKQIILATHSIEIITEVEPENILVIDKSKKTSLYTSSVPAVQTLISSIGSMQNIGLARLWSSKRLLLVEGKDIDILKRLQDTIFLGNCEPFDLIPRSSIGGWSGWLNVKGANLVLKNGLKQHLNVYCILDSDYSTEDEKQARKAEAKKIGINLHIWLKKEIENYLLNPSAIYRLILKKGQNTKALVVSDIKNKLDEIAEEMKQHLVNKYADKIHSENRGLQISSAYKLANTKVNESWNKKHNILSGKEILKHLNTWINNNYKTSITSVTLAKELKNDEIDEEVKSIINSIENNLTF